MCISHGEFLMKKLVGIGDRRAKTLEEFSQVHTNYVNI